VLIILQIDSKRRHAIVCGAKIGFRERSPVSGAVFPHGQLDAGNLLDALCPRQLRGVTKSDILPPDGYCLLAATMEDLYA